MSIFSKIFTRDGSDSTIDSFEIVTLHESAMRYTIEYEVVIKDGEAEVSQYWIRYVKDEDKRQLEKRTVCSVETVLKLFNNCKLLSWDGFDGPHPKGVLDGIMFTLKATVNGNKKIYATGSQNFPKHYREFKDGLYDILNSKKDNTVSD